MHKRHMSFVCFLWFLSCLYMLCTTIPLPTGDSMKRIVALVLFAIGFTSTVLAQATRPEQVGLSTERLKRIHDLIERRIETRDISGAVTLVARKGQIAHLDAQGLMDIETNKPMTKDAIFRIASMTKPVVGVAVLMMMEEGKIRLTDPVSKF